MKKMKGTINLNEIKYVTMFSKDFERISYEMKEIKRKSLTK